MCEHTACATEISQLRAMNLRQADTIKEYQESEKRAARAAVDEVTEAYQALALVVLDSDASTDAESYERGYLDAYADAANQAGFAAAGTPLRPRRCFELFNPVERGLRKRARQELQRRRRDRHRREGQR